MTCKRNTGFSVKLEKDLAKKITQIEDIYLRKYAGGTEKKGKRQRFINTEFDIDIGDEVVKKIKKEERTDKGEAGNGPEGEDETTPPQHGDSLIEKNESRNSKMKMPLRIEVNNNGSYINSTNTSKTDDEHEEIYDDVLLSYDLDSDIGIQDEELQLGSEDFITPPTSVDSKASSKGGGLEKKNSKGKNYPLDHDGVSPKNNTPTKKKKSLQMNRSNKKEQQGGGRTEMSILILTKDYEIIFRNTPKERYLKTPGDITQFTNQLKEITRISHAFCDNSFGDKWTEPVQTIFLTGNRFTLSAYMMPDLILAVIVPLTADFNAHHFRSDIQPIILDLQLMMRGVLAIHHQQTSKRSKEKRS